MTTRASIALLRTLPDTVWEKTNRQIAKEHKVPERHVSMFRAAHYKPRPPRKPGSGRPRLVDWTRYNPSLSLSANATILGVTKQAVGYIKNRLKNKTSK